VQTPAQNHHLLAIDLGLRCGMALYDGQGRLVWYRSQHFGSLPQLRRAAARTLGETADLTWLISEGDYSLAAIWERVAMRQGVRVQRVSAEAWRETLLYPRERRDAADAKKNAEILARRVIAWSGAPTPTALKHDAAEAILIGMWGVLSLGWLDAIPRELRMDAPRVALRA
jgi:hypothetical protein